MPTSLLLSLASFAAPGADAWELYSALHASPAVEVVAPVEVREFLEPALDELRRAGTWTAEWIDPAEDGEGEAPRIVLGTPDTPGVSAIAEALGVRLLDRGGFLCGGVRLTGRQDAAVLTAEDPMRRGLPLTLYLVNDLEFLRGLVRDLTPVWRPGHTLYSRGEWARRSLGEAGRRSPGADPRDYGAERDRLSEDAPRLRARGLLAFLLGFEDPARAEVYLELASAARERALEWLRPEDPSNARLMLYAHPEDWVRTRGRLELSDVDATGRVHAVVHEDLPHDGGAAVVEALALETLGPPSVAWLPRAIGVDAADTWWGVPLETWMKHLARTGLSGDRPSDWSAPRRHSSVHLDVPFQAYWVRLVREREGGPEYLRRVWAGEVDLSEERGVPLEVLEALASGLPEASLDPRPVDFRRGISLAPGADGFAARALDESLGRAASLGVTDVALQVSATARGWERSFAGELRPRGFPADHSDAELAFAVGAARRHGMRTMLSSHLWSSPSGPLYGEMHFTTAELAVDFFNTYCVFARHYALLAQLLGCETYCFASGLTATATTAHTGESSEDDEARELRNLRRQKWRWIIGHLRKSYDGALTYAAREGDRGWNNAAQRVEFWSQLDAVGVDLFPPLDRAADPDEVPEERVQRARLLAVFNDRCELARELGRPLLVTSIGFPSTREAWRHPWASLGAPDVAEQERLYGTLAKILPNVRRSWTEHFAGLYLWEWSADPEVGGHTDAGFTPQNKPAEKVLPELFQ